MNNKEHTKKKILIEALENSLGIVATACAKSGISRSSYYKWYHEDEEFREKVDELDNVKLDYVETQLFKNIQHEKEKSIIFYLQHRGHKRGYIQRQNINLTSNEDNIKKIEIEVFDTKHKGD
tara:strand:+ start:22 stop:387 length:366 start_codon:yes stop_codon:yes gene_type:complete